MFFRSENPTEYRLPDKPSWGDVWHDVGGLFWDGHDAIRLSNYRMFPELGPQTNWLIRDPNQLRSPFAVFDPARRDSSDLLAGSAVPAPLAVTASAPGFRGPPSLAESLAYWRFMREPKVY